MGIGTNEKPILGDESQQTKGVTGWWRKRSIATRLAMLFGLIAIMTSLLSMSVLSFVWGQHFTSYTRENMEATAKYTAQRIAGVYELEQEWSQTVLTPAVSAAQAYQGVGIMVVDTDGKVLYDSTRPDDFFWPVGEPGAAEPAEASSAASAAATDDASARDTNASAGKPAAAAVEKAPTKSSQMATANIVVDNEAVGSVRIWVYGSDSLLRQADVVFRDNSYQAMAMGSLIAIILASIIGFMCARTFVQPINHIAKTAEAIKGGDLSARTGLRGDDEIAGLGEAFDKMADAVENDRNLERRLTSDVAHELRTPLMAIQATVEAMADGVFPADEEHLNTVSSEVQRLSRMVNSMLKLSRLENRANPIKEEVVDVSELISTVVATHEAFATESGLTLHFEGMEGVKTKGDKDLIRQATANLLSNAFRYTPEGGEVWVRVSKGELMANIQVEDTGIGLTPEEAKMVFNRFWRADGGRQRADGGLGIGLSVVKEIVDRHGGWVQVEGRKNEGARFTIHLPLYHEPRAQKNAKAGKAAQRGAHTSGIANMTGKIKLPGGNKSAGGK